eukprot:10971417-Ditylum_brightwellii.AAC.1
MDQGLPKFVEFCTCLELCEPSEVKPKGEKPSKPKNAGKRRAKVSTTPITMPAGPMILRTVFELNQHAKCAKPNTNCAEANKVSYKDLNAFVNAKVTATLNKAKIIQKKRKEKEVKLNAFNKFHSMNVESSNEEDKPNKHAPINAYNDDSSASCLLSDDSSSDVE